MLVTTNTQLKFVTNKHTNHDHTNLVRWQGDHWHPLLDNVETLAEQRVKKCDRSLQHDHCRQGGFQGRLH